MKSIIASLFVGLLLISCKDAKKEESQPIVDEITAVAVGTVISGDFEITDPEALEVKWEKALTAEKGKEIELEGFEIITGKVDNNSSEEYYMIISRTNEGNIMVAALLDLRDGEFFFKSVVEGEHIMVMCEDEGYCEQEGCLPIVNVRNDKQQIDCSCRECSKEEKKIK
ncbi:MAG: hypothetical protein BM557_03290 [Flavobacterium sp. MedPE-SWcel]|uniref:hypothetical protein n=1 Tax=uncultured Flavobacterium sp. TaxID=165435 RepID=UPI00091B9C14|nr:hypothetical protein [uncultured Flavobacterium sp.]OIQ21832.1 MAG: hypothetical protein BM557_03290 [Flavobacterium sp. MedPE-SWcel]